MNDVSYIVGFDEAVREQMEHMEEPLYAFQFKLFRTQNPITAHMYGKSTWCAYDCNCVSALYINLYGRCVCVCVCVHNMCSHRLYMLIAMEKLKFTLSFKCVRDSRQYIFNCLNSP